MHCFIQWTLYWISSARQLFIKKSKWKVRNSLGLYFLHCTVCKGRAGKLCLITWHEGMIIGRNVVLIRKRNINPPVSASARPPTLHISSFMFCPLIPPLVLIYKTQNRIRVTSLSRRVPGVLPLHRMTKCNIPPDFWIPPMQSYVMMNNTMGSIVDVKDFFSQTRKA